MTQEGGGASMEEIRLAEMRGALISRLEAIEANISRGVATLESHIGRVWTWHEEGVEQRTQLEGRLANMEARLHSLEKQVERLRNTNGRHQYITGGASAVGGAGIMVAILKLVETVFK